MIRILSLLLVIQVGVVAALYWPREIASNARTALIENLAGTDVSAITVTDGDGATVSLSRAAQGWQLASGLPADEGKVTLLLTALLRTDPGYAIADSSSAAARFDVAAEDFDRRIALSTPDGEITVFLGTSPSFRKIHARRDGENAVFVIELNSYDAPVDDGAWLERALLAERDVSKVSLYGIDFTLAGESWQRTDGAPVDADAMESLVQGLASLQVSGIVAADDADAAAAGETLRIDLGDGDSRSRLTVLDNAETERYYLRSDRHDATFSTSAYDAERLVDAARTLAGLDVDADDAEESDGEGADDAAAEPGERDGEDAGVDTDLAQDEP